jgi:hypothetical protein
MILVVMAWIFFAIGAIIFIAGIVMSTDVVGGVEDILMGVVCGGIFIVLGAFCLWADADIKHDEAVFAAIEEYVDDQDSELISHEPTDNLFIYETDKDELCKVEYNEDDSLKNLAVDEDSCVLA